MLQQTPKEKGWEDKVLGELEVLTVLPKRYVHIGPVFEVKAKEGMTLRGENYLVDLQECIDAGVDYLLTNAFIGGERAYLIAKDESGRIVGTIVSSLSHESRMIRGRDGIFVTSEIKIIDKGRGLAWPVEQAFQAFLQFCADRENLPVLWSVENQNLAKLEEYRQTGEVDLARLASMEEEQRRWQALYGPNGKLGVIDGRKIFEPRKG